METSFTDPRMAVTLGTGHFPFLCTIRAVTEGTGAGGETVRTWADVTGLTAIPCSVALTAGRLVREMQLEYGNTTHRISLAGNFPAISRSHRAVVDGVTYGIGYCRPCRPGSPVTVLECTVISGGA
jgi:hypothetical protein